MQPALVVVLILSYLIGAIPFAVLVGRRLAGVHIQQVGSGNAGALNTFRSVGRKAGVIVALLDATKAALAMLIGRLIVGSEVAALCGAAAVVGHCFSPYLLLSPRNQEQRGWRWMLRRAGGKGLASGMAVLLLIGWPLALVTFVIFGLALWRIKDTTWPTIIALLPVTPLVWWWTKDSLLTWAVLIVSLVVIVKHLPDLREGYWINQ